MEALITGRLVVAGRCLRIIADQGGESYLLIWPPGFELANGPTISIVNGTGEEAARIGGRVEVSGGEESNLARIGGLMPSPSRECDGPYWVIGERVESID